MYGIRESLNPVAGDDGADQSWVPISTSRGGSQLVLCLYSWIILKGHRRSHEVSGTYVLGNVFFKEHLMFGVEDNGEKGCHITRSVEITPPIFFSP